MEGSAFRKEWLLYMPKHWAPTSPALCRVETEGSRLGFSETPSIKGIRENDRTLTAGLCTQQNTYTLTYEHTTHIHKNVFKVAEGTVR